MGVKVATSGCFHMSSSNPIVPNSHPSFSSAPLFRSDVVASYIFYRNSDKTAHPCGSAFRSTGLHRSRSFEIIRRQEHTLKRSCSANLDAFPDEEFSRTFQELSKASGGRREEDEKVEEDKPSDGIPSKDLWRRVEVGPPEWHGKAWSDVSIERKANDAGLPLSLRMIKRKIQWQEGFRVAGESAYCSVKRAFSSLVFIIRELHSCSLYMRETLSATGDIQGTLERVQREIHASFVWLFQRVFAHTPTLMVSVMLLLANFTVHSISANVALANPTPVAVEYSFSSESESSSIKNLFSAPSSSSGMSASVGSGGGGGKLRPVGSGTEGEGGRFRFSDSATLISGGASVSEENELALWDSMVNEAREMQAQTRSEWLDAETVKRFVSPVRARIEAEDWWEYGDTALMYEREVERDPNNAMLLANYAQFLYVVSHDYDRAEEMFKRAVGVEPKDAEACNKYAWFLWKERKELWAAEETFLEAISADPANSFYAANYANFLWNTGGEDTCFPLPLPDDDQSQL